MADVRLTATNPDDSTVVPVACNAKGELKLEEPLSFDGNLDGDLVVTGSGTFSTTLNTSTWPNDGSTSTGGGAHLVRNDTGDNVVWKAFSGGTGADYVTSSILGNGTATFGARKTTGDWTISPTTGIRFNSGSLETVSLFPAGGALFLDKVTARNSQSSSYTVFAANFNGVDKARILANGNFKIGGDLSGQGNINFDAGEGNGKFSGNLDIGNFVAGTSGSRISSGGTLYVNGSGAYPGVSVSDGQINLNYNGTAVFKGEVTVTSRNQQWVLTEQQGICYMMAASLKDGVDEGFSQTPPRDVIKEIDYLKDLVQALYERLKMSPEAGWEVWDGSD